jgi:hypothetical protein
MAKIISMAKAGKNKLPAEQQKELMQILETRFSKNTQRHKNLSWEAVREKLEKNPEKLWSLEQMEETGGEPDVIGHDEATNEFIFADCSAETPKERRSLCYDREALDARKENKPKNSAMDLAAEMGIQILSEEEYQALQKLGPFDQKTSSWIKTPDEMRALDGALFGDYRFGRVFIYHNGASSYYAARGFRGMLRV